MLISIILQDLESLKLFEKEDCLLLKLANNGLLVKIKRLGKP